MKKIKSIYRIFIFFFIMIIVSFLLLNFYSTASLQSSLIQVARIQVDYARALLEQKSNEIEIEADGILNSNDFRELQLMMMEKYDPYNYVMSVQRIKEYLTRRQTSNVGMAEFILYWPGTDSIIATSVRADVEDGLLEMASDNEWIFYEKEVYFVKKYSADWLKDEEAPFLFIKMEQDYLYKVKTVASGLEAGGILLLLPDRTSLFSVNEEERTLLKKVKWEDASEEFQLRANGRKYQIIKPGVASNGLELVAYYPIREMMKPVRNIMEITARLLGVILAVGFVFMVLYYKNILLQLKILTEKLKQVEGGDFGARIEELPENEFSYVFDQFNKMVLRIRELISSTLKEQQLRSQAELRQLQLQINPHFLYNSLSYIVTVADNPKAVTEMAVHLAGYYRHCTRSRSVTTIGEEVQYAKAYLSVMAMRKRMEYSISMTEDLENIPIIPLILQPIIENAVEHAIEERENAKHVHVKIYRLPDSTVRFEISDDGNGLSEEDAQRLLWSLNQKERDENESVGLWNVNQRLINYYDKSAGLRFGRSIWGGLSVSFTILPRERDNEAVDCG
ncbi:MAG TPA: histidine kinase [Candidatus Eisenbergiella merdavium]|uniref:Histidine kinase n=1 Tax=Candidatus Eisenbergiella merdavium TaxID=2838551 RepID=A0A9D2SRB8_9FIRM|nr:histidine kinase [Candidatus Eisenbergiella merdavium]